MKINWNEGITILHLKIWYCTLPRITFLLQCDPIFHLFSDLMEHSPNVLFSLLVLFEEHPQFVGKVGLLEWTLLRKLSITFSLAHLFRFFATFLFLFLKVLPIGILSTSIGSGASSEYVLVVSGGLAEGFNCDLSALIRALSIFGICTRNVRGARRSMGIGGFRSTTVSVCRSMLIHKGLGGCRCLAANSSWVMILTALHSATDSKCVSVDRCPKSGVGRHQCDPPKLIELSNSKS
ncbi:hypothetical protein IGI04_006905, partial [Brassica rapa subsp. trilocularis]